MRLPGGVVRGAVPHDMVSVSPFAITLRMGAGVASVDACSLQAVWGTDAASDYRSEESPVLFICAVMVS